MKKTTLLIISIISLLYGATFRVWGEDKALKEDLTTDEADSLTLVQRVDLLSAPDKKDSKDQGELYIPQAWEANLDNIASSWVVKNHAKKSQHPAYTKQHPVNDSVYVERLCKLNTVIELPFNDIVRDCINLYVDRRRKSVEYMLGLEHFYFPMIEQALDENGLPDELKYLAIVESALNPVAVSRAGATGLWQFMLQTGKQYGLEINSIVDERRDPVKATYAACEYFKDMYKIYGDWNLVIAAYNCGSGNVNKAIKRAGGKTDYWDIYPFLPKETRTYVPLFIAATYVMNYYPYHQLYPVEMSLPLTTDTVMVDKQVHFNQIADLIDVDVETLRALNPQYKQDIVPGHVCSRAICLPGVQALAYVQKEDIIPNHKVDEYFSNRTYAGNYSGANNDKINHKVKSGETLPAIASKYGVSLSDLRKWNGLKSNKIRSGRNLIVYVDTAGYSLASATTESSSSSSVAPAAEKKKKNTATAQNKKTKATYASYKVKQGDTLSSIAQKYRKCSYKDLMRINGLKNTKLKIGQVIKVPKV